MFITLRNHEGFTLIEMLVALVVLSIGLLGLAGLQAQSLQFNSSAAQRSQATILAYDMIDRMRANRTAAENGSYDVAMGAGPSGSSNCESGSCGVGGLAEYDVNQWLCLLGSSDAACAGLGVNGLLLEGQGSVVRNGGEVTVTIEWVDDRSLEVTNPDRKTSLSVSTIL